MQWLRTYKLILGQPGTDGIIITNISSDGSYQNDALRIAFDIDKDTTKKTNKSKLQIWNLSEDSLQKVEKDDLYCELWCGYFGENNLRRIYTGHALSVHTKDDNEGKDVLTEIHAGDGNVAVRDSLISVAYTPGTNTRPILEGIAANMGLSLFSASDVAFPDYPNGYSFVGKAADALTEICNTIGASWSIQNEVIQVIMGDGTTNIQAMVFSASTGLLGFPGHVNRSATGVSDKSSNGTDVQSTTKRRKQTKAKKERKQKKYGWKITTLLCPTVNPGDIVKIESARITGWFKVESIKHQGDLRGKDWKSVLECVEITLSS